MKPIVRKRVHTVTAVSHDQAYSHRFAGVFFFFHGLSLLLLLLLLLSLRLRVEPD